MTQLEQPIEISASPILALLGEAGLSLRVDVRSADIDVEAGRSGFGGGLVAAFRWFLKRRRPLIIVGVLSQEELIRIPGNGALRPFLELPRVCYLKLPVDLAAFQDAARAVGDGPVSDAEVQRLGDSVVQIQLDEDLYGNVIHSVDSRAVAPLFKQWVDGLREDANGARGQGGADTVAREPADYHDSLASALRSLERLIAELDDQVEVKRAAAPVLRKLRTQAESLRRAKELAGRLVEFEQGERLAEAGTEALEEAAQMGREVLRIKAEVVRALYSMVRRRAG